MAYMSQENKASKTPAIKTILKKYELKGSLRVSNHSTLMLTIRSGKIDFIKDYAVARVYTEQVYIQVNPYYIDRDFNAPSISAKALNELLDVMNIGNHDNSNPQFDHFDVGWYSDINIGNWDKPYIKE